MFHTLGVDRSASKLLKASHVAENFQARPFEHSVPALAPYILYTLGKLIANLAIGGAEWPERAMASVILRYMVTQSLNATALPHLHSGP